MSTNGFVSIEANEVHFSINSHKPGSLRVLPQLFQDRVNLCLYDEALERPASVLSDLKVMLIRFLSVAKDYGVRPGHGQVIIGTSIPESQVGEIHDLVKETLMWPTKILNETEEFEAFIYGLAGAFHPVNGIFLKVTARSALISWIHYTESKELIYGQPHSMPYGGIALARRLRKESFEDIEAEISRKSSEIFAGLNLPPALEKMGLEERGFRLYIHSPGFPLVMRFIHGCTVSPLLLSSFNSTGFSCAPSELNNVPVQRINNYLFSMEEKNKNKAAFLQSSLVLFRGVTTGIPPVRKLLYDRSTTREGILFQQMPNDIFAEDPLIVSTAPYALPGAAKLAEVLATSLPPGVPIVISKRIVRGLANSAYIHSSYPRGTQALMGLTVGQGGVLTGIHGITHEVRVLLGIGLFKRWGGESSEASSTLLSAYKSLFTDWHRFWWAFYIGCILFVLGAVFPGAHVRENVISFSTQGDHNRFTLFIRVNQKSVFANNPVVIDRLRKLPASLVDVQHRLGIEYLPVQVQVEWYSD